jgi:hypothetical protein
MIHAHHVLFIIGITFLLVSLQFRKPTNTFFDKDGLRITGEFGSIFWSWPELESKRREMLGGSNSDD